MIVPRSVRSFNDVGVGVALGATVRVDVCAGLDVGVAVRVGVADAVRVSVEVGVALRVAVAVAAGAAPPYTRSSPTEMKYALPPGAP